MSDSKKVDLSSSSVAYFDKDVEEAGFYVLDGKADKSKVKVFDGGEFHLTTATDDDGGEYQTVAVDDNGRPVWKTQPTEKEEITVKHESNMTPGKRVYPSPDGDGFQYDDPDEGSDNG